MIVYSERRASTALAHTKTKHAAPALPMCGPSHVVPHDSTTPARAQCCLFCLFLDRVPHTTMAHARLCGPCAFLSLSTACHTWLTRDCAQTRGHATLRTAQSKRREPNRKKAKEQTNKTHSTGPSHVVPHHSTTPARASLTSLFGWEAVILACMAVCVRQRSQLTFIATTVQPNSQVKLDLAGGEL